MPITNLQHKLDESEKGECKLFIVARRILAYVHSAENTFLGATRSIHLMVGIEPRIINLTAILKQTQ